MYPDSKSRSQQLYDRALASLPGGNRRTTVFMKPYPIYAARGEGCRVWDVDGNEYIDCINNFTSLIHGHAHPSLVEAATQQLALGSAFGQPTESEIDLAELLASRLPAVEQVRFANSGTEAVMMALKAARAFTGRPKIAKCEGAYHGSYDYAEVSLDPTPEAWGRNAPVSVAYAKGTPENVLSDVVTIPFNDAEAAVSLIREHGPELACVLVDPMPNRAGLAAMQLLDEPVFARLDAIGEAVRTGIDQAFRRSGVSGGTVGLGSLLKIHFADRPIRDYRSAYLTEQEAQRQVVFNRGLLNRGVLAAGYGLMALSTPMTDADVDAIVAAASGALAEVAASV